MKQAQPNLSVDALAHVRVHKVAEILGVSVPTVWRWAREGRIPAPRKLGPGTTAWNVGDLRRYLDRFAVAA